jgi:hypothetical protein
MPDNAVVNFKPSDTLKVYRGTGPDHREMLVCKTAGEYECSPEKAAQVCADFPDNFKLKSAGQPTANKMGVSPTGNK